MWNDRNFGIYNQTSLKVWVDASYYEDLDSKNFLFDYFYPISHPHFQALLAEIKELASAMDTILSNRYCPEEQTSACTGYRLAVKQLASAGVTNNPPPGSDPEESVCTSNSTCVGSPEIVTFLRKEFKDKYSDQKYQNLSFSEECVEKLFTPYKGLLNIGFIQKVYSIGEKFDEQKNDTLLT